MHKESRKRNIFLSLFLVFVCNTVCLSQSSSIKPSYKISDLNDIPQNDINKIYRDSKGFMWLGTLDGLHRYDGYEYKTYRLNETKNSISSNMIIGIDEDSHGNLWIGTYGRGICKLDPVTEQFTVFSEKSTNGAIRDDVTCILVDDQDVIWIGNWFGTTRVRFDDSMTNIQGAELFSVSEQQEGASLGEVKAIHQDGDKNIWIGSNSQIVRVIRPYAVRKDVRFEAYDCVVNTICDYENGILIGGNSVLALQKKEATTSYAFSLIAYEPANALMYENNKLWIGYRRGLRKYYRSQLDGWVLEKRFRKDYLGESIRSNIVTTLATDEVGQLWVGTRGGGVSLVRQNAKKFEHYQQTSDTTSLSDNLVKCIYEDHQNNLWIGTEAKGVNVLPHDQFDYSSGFKNILINKFDVEDRVYAIKESMLPNSTKHKSLMWLGTSYPMSLAVMDPVTFKRKELPKFVQKIGFVFALEIQNDSILWVGSYGKGLWRLILDNDGEIKRHDSFSPLKSDSTSISSRIIRSIFKDKAGNLWIGTDKGLNKLSASEILKKQPKFERLTRPEVTNNDHIDYILQITQTHDGKIWMGSMGAGLISYEEHVDGTASFSQITTTNGLPNNAVKSIIEDENGFLWLSTNSGLTRYDPVTRSVVNYDENDGLQDKEFGEISACKRSNGQLIFGGIRGFNVFRPDDIVIDTIKPKLFLTDFYLLNKEVKPGQVINDRVLIEKGIEYTKNIELEYSENSFSIGFVGVHFNSPQNNNYRYKLEGFDKVWFNATTDYRVAKYTNIPDGEYTFMVMGANCDNVWSDSPIALKIRIKSPPYRNTIAIILYFTIFVLLGWVLFKVLRIISNRKKELLISNIEKQQVEEVAQIKLRFFTNISHEFRTPLTLIKAPLENLINNKKLPADERLKNQMLINQNVNVMLRLVNQLMDFRKLDQGKMKISVQKQDIHEFIHEVYNLFAPLAGQKSIEFKLNAEPEELFLWFDSEKMEKVLFNLLSNAFKFTPRGGQVIMSVERLEEGQQVQIKVQDTGVGIDSSETKHIFERYYQPDRNGKSNFGGTGIGLALSKGLIEMHKGEIFFSSVLNEGSVFTVTLPLGDKHLTDEIYQGDEKGKRLPDGVRQPELVPSFESVSDVKQVPGQYKHKILLVEDNVELRLYLVDIFKKDFFVIEAEDGVEGLEMCSSNLPDIVVSDIMMPRMSGTELCEKIKTEEEISHIPVLLLTAKNTEESQVEGLTIGADGYLTKPFSTEVLRAHVFSIIKNREQLRQRFQTEIEIHPEIVSNTPSDSKFLTKILAIVEDNLSESEFSVEKMAETYGVSRVYLNRKIKALTGETSNQFLRNIRLKHAAELLKTSNLTVAEVTWKVGYNDLRTFRTRFKDMFGVSPSDFSKSAKAKKQ